MYLSTDIVRQIYEYDLTFREKFQETLDKLVPTRMKVLQKFLSVYVGYVMWDWQHITLQNKEDSFKVVFKDGDEKYFRVLTINESEDSSYPRLNIDLINMVDGNNYYIILSLQDYDSSYNWRGMFYDNELVSRVFSYCCENNNITLLYCG